MKALLISFYVFLSPMPAPELTIMLSTEPSVVEIHWEHLSGGVTEYHLYRSRDGAHWSLLQVIYGDDNSYVDHNVKKQHHYRYCLQAKYRNGQLSGLTRPVRAILE